MRAVRTTVDVTSIGQILLAPNVNRFGATVFNNSGAILFVGLGVATTSTDFTIRMLAQEYYEIPFEFKGAITAIRTGAGIIPVRVTELI